MHVVVVRGIKILELLEMRLLHNQRNMRPFHLNQADLRRLFLNGVYLQLIYACVTIVNRYAQSICFQFRVPKW